MDFTWGFVITGCLHSTFYESERCCCRSCHRKWKNIGVCYSNLRDSTRSRRSTEKTWCMNKLLLLYLHLVTSATSGSNSQVLSSVTSHFSAGSHLFLINVEWCMIIIWVCLFAYISFRIELVPPRGDSQPLGSFFSTSFGHEKSWEELLCWTVLVEQSFILFAYVYVAYM